MNEKSVKQKFRMFSAIDTLPPETQVKFWRDMFHKSRANLALCLCTSFFVVATQGDGGFTDIHKQVDDLVATSIARNNAEKKPPLNVPELRGQLNTKAGFLENLTLLACAGFTGLSIVMLRGSTRRLREAEQKLKP